MISPYLLVCIVKYETSEGSATHLSLNVMKKFKVLLCVLILFDLYFKADD